MELQKITATAQYWLVLQLVNQNSLGYRCYALARERTKWHLHRWTSSPDGGIVHNEVTLSNKVNPQQVLSSAAIDANNVVDCGEEYCKDSSVAFVAWHYRGKDAHAAQISPYQDPYHRHQSPKLTSFIIEIDSLFKQYFST
jgi:hypothetical protein